MSSFKEQLQSLPSVAGIVHSAMVLRDAFVKDWTFKTFTDVMGPKIKGETYFAYVYLYNPKWYHNENLIFFLLMTISCKLRPSSNMVLKITPLIPMSAIF